MMIKKKMSLKRTAQTNMHPVAVNISAGKIKGKSSFDAYLKYCEFNY